MALAYGIAMTQSNPRSPIQLWQQADAEHPDDPDARRVAYIALMKQAGHIVRIDDYLLTPDEQAALSGELAKIHDTIRPCWRRDDRP